jgi:type I restriction enzyme S subunit
MIDTIVNSFDIWVDAQGIKSRTRVKSVGNISLEGIKKLRNVILDFAIKGKMVPQNPSEESADVLLKKVVDENELLHSSEKIKENKPLLKITEKEKTFNLPNGWAWARFGNISLIERGGSPRPIESYLTNDADGLNWIKIGDTEIGGKYITSTREKIRREGLTKTRMVYPGDFLLTNSMSFGRPYITKIEGCIHDGWLRIHPPRSLNKDYLYHLLSSSYVSLFFKMAAAGAVVLNLNADKVRELPIPIPPLVEQQRIVDKVDELMSLCDKLEAEKFNNLKTHQSLVKTLLNTLTQAADANELQEAWERMSPHFDTLFSTEDSIDQLKQGILQLAIMGRLVKQDPNDEQISKVVTRIKREKEKLIEEGKLKRQIPLPKIDEKEKPFKLPDSWEWVRLGEVTTYGISEKVEPGDVENTTWILELEHVEKGSSKLLEKVRVADKQFQSSKNKFYKGDLIYGKLRPYLDKVIIADEDGICTTEMIPFKAYLDIIPEYMRLVLKSAYFINYATNSTHGMNLPRLGTEKARLALFPLASEREQYEIVSKVDTLFLLCDTLKDRLSKAQDIQVSLSKTIVKKAIA